MGAAAQLDRIGRPAGIAGAHRDDAHLIAVFLAEQGHRAALDRFIGRHEPGFDRGVLADAGVDLALDGAEFRSRHRAGLGDVEAQAVRRVQAALLRHVRAEGAAQRLVQQVGRRMVGADGAAAGVIDLGMDGIAGGDLAFLDRAVMDEEIAGLFLGVGDADGDAGGGERAGVADLAAAFGVEGRLVEDEGDLLPGLGAAGGRAVHHHGEDAGIALLGRVAEELGAAETVAQVEPDGFGRGIAGAGPGGAGAGFLLGHRRGEALVIEAAMLLAQRVFRQVEREAVGVVELEGDRAREFLARAEFLHLILKEREAAFEHDGEFLLFQFQCLDDQGLGAGEFGEGDAHLAGEGGDQAVDEGFAHAEPVGVAHGAAHDPAQHVAAALVRGQHAIGDQEGGGAEMIRDDAVADLVRAVGIGVGDLGRGEDEGAQRVGIVVVVLALEDGGEALQAHAGVDRGAGQRVAHAGRLLEELHEDEVPDLDEAVAILVRAAGRAAGNGRAVIVEDFRAGAAGAGIAHAPEIVVGRDPDDFLIRQSGDPFPERGGLVVLVVDGDEEFFLRQAEVAGQQGPGVLDRDVLEIVAEGEVAEHLEEGVVPGGVADIVEIVVLAAGADAFLRGGGADIGPVLVAGEDVLERHHAGIDEHQRRVVARHQGCGGHHLVAVAGEEVEEGGADVVAGGHEKARDP
ncbi:hypothetical protein APM_0875 [Acidiphilium sp. PM]|nr:hypothetical protein APM_0875 [Acidiphilium sp. PM]